MICTLHTSMQDLKLYGADDAVASQVHVSLMLLFLTAGNKQYNTGTVFTHSFTKSNNIFKTETGEYTHIQHHTFKHQVFHIKRKG